MADGGGLEIISLGNLYSGRWEKRYWSSSRGKDRYPYPVGFRATRDTGGYVYTLEIQEGKSGPVFEVECSGMVGTGHTPDSAWRDVRKKKHLPGSRSPAFSGDEMFGFSDPYLQGLLRSLAREEQSMLQENAGSQPEEHQPDLQHERDHSQDVNYSGEETAVSSECSPVTNSQVTDSIISLLFPQARPFLKTRKKRKHSTAEVLDLEPLPAEEPEKTNEALEQPGGALEGEEGLKERQLSASRDVDIKVPEPSGPEMHPAYRHFGSRSKLVGPCEKLEPVAAFEHNLPVLSIALNTGERNVDLCVYCDNGGFKKQVFVYRVLVRVDETAEAQLLRSLILNSEVQQQDTPRFAHEGKLLLVIGCLIDSQSGDGYLDSNVISVVSLVNTKEPVLQLKIAACIRMRCLLVTGPTSFVAGGYGGCVMQWKMDPNWRLVQSESSLPAAVHNCVPLHAIVELVCLPNAPQLVIGTDAEGSFATWDLSSGLLLSTFHTANYRLQNLQMIDSATHGTGYLCLMANVSSVHDLSTFWTMVAIRDDKVFVGMKLHDSSAYVPLWRCWYT